MKTPVAIVRCDSYEPAEVDKAVRSVMELLRAEEILPVSGPVLLKPNMLAAFPPEAAVTTHPQVVAALARYLSGRGVRVSVGDSQGRGIFEDVAEATGMREIAEQSGCNLVSFDEKVTVRAEASRICREFPIARPVAETPALINVAKMKTHGFMTFTGAVKNLYGCVSGAEKGRFHLRFPDSERFGLMLLDLLSAVRPKLSVLDAVVAMDGPGPSHGRARHAGLLMASPDPVALDIVAMHVAGADPMAVPYLALARRHGVGATRIEDIEVAGRPVEEVLLSDFQMPRTRRPALLEFQWAGPLRNSLAAKPVIDRRLCRLCGQCVKSCPAGVMTLSSSQVLINRNACIKCYCCQEMCPFDAISLKKGPLAKLAESVAGRMAK